MKLRLPSLMAMFPIVLGMAINSARALTITGGTATLTLEEGKADSISWLDAYFSDAKTRGQTLSDPAPGDAPYVRLSGTPGTIGTGSTSGVLGVPGIVQVTDTIRPFGVIPTPPAPDTYPGTPGSSRSRQVTTLDFSPTNILGSWTASTDLVGVFVTTDALSEQIAFTCMQRWGGPFTGVLIYGDFALRYVPTRAGTVAPGGTLSGLAMVSNIDFLDSSWADLANASITFSNNTLNISGDLLISGALNLLDPTATVGTKFGTFSMNATVLLPTPLIHRFARNGGMVTLEAMNGLPNGGYTVLSSTNLALPLAAWSVSATGSFDASGTCSNSIPTLPGESARFFRLQQP